MSINILKSLLSHLLPVVEPLLHEDDVPLPGSTETFLEVTEGPHTAVRATGLSFTGQVPRVNYDLSPQPGKMGLNTFKTICFETLFNICSVKLFTY